MASNEFDVQRPAREIEIASAIRGADPEAAEVIRRLAFQRDRWRDDIRDVIHLMRAGCLNSAERNLERLLGEQS